MDKTVHIDESHVAQDVFGCSAECRAQFLTVLASSDRMLKTIICQTLPDEHGGGRDDFHIPYYCGSQPCKINGKDDADQQCALNT